MKQINTCVAIETINVNKLQLKQVNMHNDKWKKEICRSDNETSKYAEVTNERNISDT